MSEITPKLDLTLPAYRDPRWDIINNANFDILDGVHGTVIAVDKILETTANAVDTFIYDTSKDSDGGAWRKRCRLLSWYNETLNTSTRGATKEFPAVCLVVAEDDTVTLYDLTDPSVPMWMVFVKAGNSDNIIRVSSIIGVVMLNGVLFIGGTENESSICNVELSLLKDSATYAWTGATQYKYAGNIVDRNNASGIIEGAGYTIVSNKVNYVAITVLPNAPVDQVTGVPVPTKLVPTEIGASWIKDDDTVVDATGAINLIATDINSSGLSVMASSSTVYVFNNIPSSDVALTSADYITSPVGTITSVKLNGSDIILGTSEGFIVTNYNESSPNDSTAYQTTGSFFSGIMKGDIKLATLADSVAGDIVDLIVNGGFDTDTDWAKGTGWAIGAGVATCDGTQTGNTLLTNPADSLIQDNKKYTVTMDVNSKSGGDFFVYLYGDSFYGTHEITTTGTQEFVININNSGGSANNVFLVLAVASTVCEIDNISVTPCVEDRSVNNNPLQVIGTMTKAPVTTGSELMAYLGFSATDYITGTNALYVDTLYAYGWQKDLTDGWVFVHGVVSASPIDGLTIAATVLKIEGTLDKSLIRLTNGAPSDEQLVAIENQEKKLFEEEAEYILPSDNVQALDFDDISNTLVVGTDLGTVRFKDLRKIDDLISVTDQTSQDIVAVTANDSHVGLVTAAETGVIVPALNIRENDTEVKGRLNALVKEAGLEELLRLTNCFNGVKIDVKDIRVDGSAVHIDFEADGGGDIPFKYGDTWYTLDCTNGDGPDGIATVILEQGTDEEPLFQFIHMFYSESSQKVEVATTNVIPDDGKFGPVCYALCFTATKVAATGMAYIHRITDIVSDDTRGALSYAREKLRLGIGGNNRIRGCNIELEMIHNAASRDNIHVTSIPGTFYQLHRHDWAGYYSGDYGIRALSQMIGECTIPNYGMIYDLGTIAEDYLGDALADGDSVYIDVVGIGTSCSCQRLAFVLSRLYSTPQECIDLARLKIALPFPNDIRHLCFTLARIVLTYSAAEGGSWSNALSDTTMVWKSEVIATATPSYPYYPNGAAEYIGPTLYHAGAVSVRVHFRDFDTERNYDYVRLRNAGGTNIYSYHGSLGAFTSSNMGGDTIRPYFQSDGSVTRKGAYIDRFEYQVEVSTGGGEIIDMR